MPNNNPVLCAMNQQENNFAPETWKVDHALKRAVHPSGLIVQVIADPTHPESLDGRCVNALAWVREDFQARAPRMQEFLHSALAAYKSAPVQAAPAA
jgi:hypothetical protein